MRSSEPGWGAERHRAVTVRRHAMGRRLWSWLAALTLLASLVGLPQAASAGGGTVSGVPSSAWQTNGTVWAMAYANGIVYLGGDFTTLRPPGAAPGTQQIPANHLAAINASTGAPISFPFATNGQVHALTVSPDGTKLYLGGYFTNVNGKYRGYLARINLTTNTLDPWVASPNGRVLAVATSGTTVYIGGGFSSIKGQARSRLAAIDANTSAVLAWNPTADNDVAALAVSADGTKVAVGGYFNHLDGVTQRAFGVVDATTGQNTGWTAPIPLLTNSCTSAIKAIRADSSLFYIGSEGTGGGCFDGTFAISQTDGSSPWLDYCLGATQALVPIGDYLYTGSHGHDCGAVPGGFPRIPNKGMTHHLIAESLSTGAIQPWYPMMNGGIATPGVAALGPRAMTTDGQNLFVGGQFTSVNFKPQQGFAIFRAGPDVTRPVKPPTPTAVSTAAGVVSVSVYGTMDRDDGPLTYYVYRDGGATPVCTIPASADPNASPWSLPVLNCRDSGLTPGSSHTYRVAASDGTNMSWKSLSSAAVTVAGSDPALSYPQTVTADNPMLYWRLGDAGASTTAADSSGNAHPGIYGSGASATLGAIPNDSNGAVSLDGSPSGYVTSAQSFPSPATFSVEGWFRTTSQSGGSIIGFGSSQTGLSSAYSRQLFITSSGLVAFGVFASGRPITILSPNAYNDGQWHYVVGTLGSNGMALYIDGRLIGTNTNKASTSYTGYWRIGGDKMAGWTAGNFFPPANYLPASVDEVAVYPYQLTSAQVATHYAANYLEH